MKPTAATIGAMNGTPSQWAFLSSGPVTWSLRAGVSPTVQTFHMTPSDADALWDYATATGKNQPLIMRFSAGGEQVDFKYLYLLHRAAGPNPHISAVQIADRRLFWTFGWVGPRRYNWRRRSGYKRMAKPNEPLDLADPVTPEIWYAPWSLQTAGKPGVKGPAGIQNKWGATMLLENVLRSVLAVEEEYAGVPSIKYKYSGRFKAKLPLENVLIDAGGDAAVAQALNYIPGADIYIEPGGDVVIKDKSEEKKDPKIHKSSGGMMGAEKVGRGHVQLINNQLMRPKVINVLFTREVEVRFDFWERATATGAPSVVSGLNELDQETRFLKNVLPVPDFVLPGTKKPMGSWVTFDEALRVWNDTGLSPRPPGKDGNPIVIDLDYPFIRKGMVPFMDMWAPFRLIGQYSPNQDWMGRLGAVQAHYRRTFAISQRWLNKIQSMRADRVSTIDPENGVRAPALVLANHCRLASQKSLSMDQMLGLGDRSYYSMSVLSYPAKNPDADPDPNTQDPAVLYPIKQTPFGGDNPIVHAPATLSIIDADQGIFSVNFHADPYKNHEMVLPSLMELGGGKSDPYPEDPGPSPDPRADHKGSIAFNMIPTKKLNQYPQLTASHKLAAIFTCIPAAWGQEGEGAQGETVPIPNQQLEMVAVTPDMPELKDLLSDKAAESLGQANGPPMYVRINATQEVARIAWNDVKYQEIERIFGLRPGIADTKDLVVNRDQMSTEGASINQISLGVAARIYASLVDRFQGDKTSTISPEAVPTGWIQEITHTIDSSGEGSTRVDLPEEIPPLDLISYLDTGTRQLLLKLARPGE